MSTTDEESEDRGDKKSAEGTAARSGTSYPYYGLQEALRVAEAVQRAGGNEATDDDVRKELNLTSKTSRGWSYRVSSAREFGLIERAGRAQDARIRITPLYKRYAMPENEAEKRAALMQALSSPPLYKKLLERYRGSPLPSAAGAANVLVREYGLLDSVKQEAAEAFVKSLQFAGAVNLNNIVTLTATPAADGSASAEESVDQAAPPPAPAPLDKGDTSPQPMRVPAGFIPHVFQLRRELQIVVPLPPDLTMKDVERLNRWMQTLPIEDDSPTKEKPM